MIIGWHTYYRIATDVNLDLNKYAFLVTPSLKKKIERPFKKNFRCSIVSVPKSKVWKEQAVTICEKAPLYSPLATSNTRIRCLKKKIINKFTAEGRTEIHKQLENINMGVLHYLMLNPDMGKSIEYNDNRLSLYSAQQGKMCSHKETA